MFVAGAVGLVLLGYLEYRRLIDYCEGSPEVEAGGDRFSCLEPYNWMAEAGSVLGGVIVLIGLGILVVVAFGRDRRDRTLDS